MRRVLNQAANAAAKAKGTVVYRRLVPRLGHPAISAIGHRLCRLIWMITSSQSCSGDDSGSGSITDVASQSKPRVHVV
jgi:hypothetical protein